MKAKEKIRIEVADDHPVVREGLVAIINQCNDMEVVAEAANGRDAVDLFVQKKPHLVLMDLRMPIVDGLTAIREIVRAAPDARIAALTTYASDEDIRQAFEAGARGYLLKGSPKLVLLDAIRSVYLGEQVLASELLPKVAETSRGRLLTVRELMVLRLIANGDSNAEIARNLGIHEGTVKVHVHRVLQKLEARSRSEAITIALKRGLLQIAESR